MKKGIALFILIGLIALMSVGGAKAEVLDLNQAKYINSGKSLWYPDKGLFQTKTVGNPWDETLNWAVSIQPNTKYRVIINGDFPEWATMELKSISLPTVVYAAVRFKGSGILVIEFTSNSLATGSDSRVSLEFGKYIADYLIKSISVESFQDGVELLLGDAKSYFVQPEVGTWNPATGEFFTSATLPNTWDASIRWPVELQEGLEYRAEIEAYSNSACNVQVQLKDEENPAQLYAPTQTVELNGKIPLSFMPIVTDKTARLAFNFGGCREKQTIKSVKFFKLLSNVSQLKAVPTHDSVVLSWTKVAGATGYEIFIRSDSGDWQSVLHVDDVDSAKISNLVAGVSYEFRVVVLGGQSQSDGATIKTATIPWFGDVNGDLNLELDDAITALRVVTRMPTATVKKEADVNGDGRIGMQEAIFVLQKLAELRP